MPACIRPVFCDALSCTDGDVAQPPSMRDSNRATGAQGRRSFMMSRTARLQGKRGIPPTLPARPDSCGWVDLCRYVKTPTTPRRTPPDRWRPPPDTATRRDVKSRHQAYALLEPDERRAGTGERSRCPPCCPDLPLQDQPVFRPGSSQGQPICRTSPPSGPAPPGQLHHFCATTDGLMRIMRDFDGTPALLKANTW